MCAGVRVSSAWLCGACMFEGAHVRILRAFERVVADSACVRVAVCDRACVTLCLCAARAPVHWLQLTHVFMFCAWLCARVCLCLRVRVCTRVRVVRVFERVF